MSICTVISSVLAWRNSKKTQKDVCIIESIKNEILDKQNIEEIGLVKEEIIKVKRVATKYRNIKNIYTVNKDIEKIQTSLTIIKENRGIFKCNNNEKNESDFIYDEIKKLEHKLLDIQDCINKNKNFNGELVVKIARNLVIKLDDFIAKLKELKDIKKYK